MDEVVEMVAWMKWLLRGHLPAHFCYGEISVCCAGPLVMQLLCKLKLTSVREIMISCSGVRVIPDFPQKGIDAFNLLSFFLQRKKKKTNCSAIQRYPF